MKIESIPDPRVTNLRNKIVGMNTTDDTLLDSFRGPVRVKPGNNSSDGPEDITYGFVEK